jgi:hypothetical protein
MKIMLTWKIHEGKLAEALARFARMTPDEERQALGPHLRLINRWHDLVRGRGVVLYECNQAEALAALALHWNDLMNVEIGTVLDDAETRALARSRAVGP